MYKRPLSLLLVFITLLFIASSCKNNPSGNDKGEYLEINSWVQSQMERYYFWNELVPEEVDGVLPPEDFFASMLEPSDNFSYISDDAQSLLAELNGSSYTAGFSPAFGRFSGTDDVFIVVEFVYPGSPAENAGIERGDIILEINGQGLTIDNYLDLYYDESETTTYTFGEYDPEQNSVSLGGSTTLTKAELSLDPVVYTDIIEVNSQKIGYLFYARFLTGEENQFIESVDNALSEFANQGITELVVDLRYNPGGRISAAKNLANSIAPSAVTANEEAFIRYNYNAELEQYYIEQEGLDSPNLVSRFSADPTNLNLERAYFLTTSGSASASELLIIGLRPYMDVIMIGTPTYGKFYGSYVLTGENASPPNNYAMVPVTLKYENANGFSDFRDGLAPDYTVEEDLFQPKAIGDTTDVLLAKAIQLITGADEPAAKVPSRIPYQLLDDPIKLRKGNVLFEDEKLK
ncbi:MAG: PDZ domain-containing protein [Gracilimonas sp.]|uniref:S41 family peptidase n=1 Tax=Gracilimonas sp. TaxID=1974203 RepID=UPI0019CF3815|nr:S41 family peptidase [Gracilimonas sp.]MBD3617201.1 PDZ domain-containing protein [Gracilimonas sp.]